MRAIERAFGKIMVAFEHHGVIALRNHGAIPHSLHGKFLPEIGLIFAQHRRLRAVQRASTVIQRGKARRFAPESPHSFFLDLPSTTPA
jgi:hypothetical protein